MYREAKANSNDNYVSILSTNHSLNFSYSWLSFLINKAPYSWLQLHILKLHLILYLRKEKKEKKAKSLSYVRFFATPWTVAHGILQARILEWVASSFSRGSSRPRDQTWVSHIAGRHFNLWATREAHLPTFREPKVIMYKIEKKASILLIYPYWMW